MSNQARIEKMQQKLNAAFAPCKLTITDDSHRHIGHEGAKGGQGHFSLSIQSEQLNQIPRLQAHRQIYAALGDMMTQDIHALRITILPT